MNSIFFRGDEFGECKESPDFGHATQRELNNVTESALFSP